MPAVYQRPRVRARLNVPVMGTTSERKSQASSTDVITYDVNVAKLEVVSNDHNAADEVEVELDWNEAGTDPRLITNAEIYVWLANADGAGQIDDSDANLSFVGIMVDGVRHVTPDKKRVVLRAHDYTTLFLKSKPYPESGAPEFTQTLQDAWQKICDNTGAWDIATGKIQSTVQALRDKIKFVGVDGGTLLGKAVSKRFAKFGKVQVRAQDDAWAVWLRCVGMLGLISFIRKDQCIVTTSTDYYTQDDPPRLIWGRNIADLREARDVNSLSGKGVGLTSFDPLTGTTIEAFYPPTDDPAKAVKKRVVASANGQPQAITVKDYEFFSYSSVSDPDVLAICAQRVYEERSRQELTGELKTSDMIIPTVNGRDFDLLTLQSGDRIHIELEQGLVNDILRLQTLEARTKYLIASGYSNGTALLMAKNVDVLGKLSPEFQVRQVRTTLETTPEGGSFDIAIQFINRIDISGDSGTG